MPLSNPTPAADLSAYQAKSEKDAANGYLGLNASALVPAAKLPGSLIVNPMSAQYDLMLGGSTAVIDYALAANGATITCNSGSGTNMGNAIDGNDATFGLTQTAVSLAVITVNLGQARTIRSFRLLQGTYGYRFTVSSSDDGITYTTRYTTPSDAAADTGVVNLSAEITARYWQVDPTSGDFFSGWNDPWKLYTVSLLSPAPTAGWPSRLPAPSGPKALRSSVAGAVGWLSTLDVYIADVSNPPTNAELISAIGAVATVGAGYAAIVDDNNAHTNVYLVVCDGAKYLQVALTACA